MPESKAEFATDSTCLYDVLGVARDVDADGLKRAFRRVALKWHPDKHVGEQEWATAIFQRCHHAYEVLADRNERAWYDDHRDAILRAGHAQGGEWGESGVQDQGAAEDDTPDLYPFFSASAFRGFDEGEHGSFFAVYGRVFDIDIAEGEQRAAKDPAANTLPAFGGWGATWAAVDEFYQFFRKDFASKRSFAFADIYFTPDAPNRDIRRRMEKENFKYRGMRRRAFEAKVRQLADFVYKRDPRVTAHHISVERKAKKEAKRRAKRLAGAKEAARAKYVADRAAWMEEQAAEARAAAEAADAAGAAAEEAVAAAARARGKLNLKAAEELN